MYVYIIVELLRLNEKIKYLYISLYSVPHCISPGQYFYYHYHPRLTSYRKFKMPITM